MNIADILFVLFMVGGLFFFTTATLGLLRFPDFYSRLHATGKGDTLAVFLSLLGLGIYEGFSLTMFLAQPTATHAISRAGFRSGLKPWFKEEKKS